MVRMGLIVTLPLMVRVRREASTSSGNSVGVAKAERPLPNPPQRAGVPPNHLKHNENGLPLLGEGWGGALGGLEWGLMWNSRPLGRVRGGAYTSSGNSEGVAFPQPRVAGEARYPGYIYNKV